MAALMTTMLSNRWIDGIGFVVLLAMMIARFVRDRARVKRGAPLRDIFRIYESGDPLYDLAAARYLSLYYILFGLLTVIALFILYVAVFHSGR